MLNTEQIAVLQEVTNIGMGQAGAAMAKVLSRYVELSIPRIYNLPPDRMPAELERIVGGTTVSAVRQAFHGSTRGEAIAIYDEARCNDLADLMGYVSPLDHASEVELLLDVSNMLIGGCMEGIARELKAPIGFSAPSLLAEHVCVASLLDSGEGGWEQAMLVEVHFSVQERSFACNIVILIPSDELSAFAGAIDNYAKAYQ